MPYSPSLSHARSKHPQMRAWAALDIRLASEDALLPCTGRDAMGQVVPLRLPVAGSKKTASPYQTGGRRTSQEPFVMAKPQAHFPPQRATAPRSAGDHIVSSAPTMAPPQLWPGRGCGPSGPGNAMQCNSSGYDAHRAGAPVSSTAIIRQERTLVNCQILPTARGSPRGLAVRLRPSAP